MHHIRIFASCWLIVIFCTTAAAYDIQQGIHGMNWGSSIADRDDLTKVHQSNQAAYYINSNMLYQVAKQPIPGVFYGFYRDQFFSFFIKLRSPFQFSHMKRQFSAKYGKPKSTVNTASKQTVYRWKDGDVKIKLKLKESIGEYKLAFYYSPLAAKLNQEQLERIPASAFGANPPKKDKTVKSVPLLDF